MIIKNIYNVGKKIIIAIIMIKLITCEKGVKGVYRHTKQRQECFVQQLSYYE